MIISVLNPKWLISLQGYGYYMLLYTGVAFLECLIIGKLLKGLLGEARVSKRGRVGLYWGLALGLGLFQSLVVRKPDLIELLLHLLLFAAICLQYYGEIQEKMMTGLLYVSGYLSMHFLMVYLLGIPYYMKLLPGSMFSYQYELLQIGPLVLLWGMVEFICRYGKREKPPSPVWLGVLLLAIPTVSLAVLYNNFSDWLVAPFLERNLNQEQIILTLLGEMVVFSCFTALVVLFQFQEGKKHTYEKRLLAQEAREKEMYYKKVEENQQEIRRIRHDLYNQLLGKARPEDIMKVLEDSQEKIYTQNPVVNAILSDKFARAASAHISITAEVHLPENLKVAYGDMGILLGNLLDNAVEACQKTEGAWIRLQMSYQNACLLLELSNPTAGPPVTWDRLGGTTKKDAKNHGIGLNSVRQVVENYDGYFHAGVQEGVFCVELMLNQV